MHAARKDGMKRSQTAPENAMTTPEALDPQPAGRPCWRATGPGTVFVTGVLTTGIYCRPSCPARHPARGNVRFFPMVPQRKGGPARLPALPAR
jgi:AraC family transcriptional regulator of adaptative response/methylated-DNA-[protein]-cysteine methyltransferase